MKEKTKVMLLFAPSIHCGGGLTLLRHLLDELPNDSVLVVDQRLPIRDEELSRFKLYRVKPTLWHRLAAEWLLKRLAEHETRVFCFGNQPPLFKLKAKVTVFIQNRHLIEPRLMDGLPLKLRLRLLTERFWLKYFCCNADQLVVQTPSMRTLASPYASKPVIVAPFVNYVTGVQSDHDSVGVEVSMYDFIYVASGDPHKNHRNLIDAWVELSHQGFYPSLCLTVEPSKYPEVSAYFEERKKEYGLKIDNLGNLTRGQVIQLYGQAKALIFPSVLESFGLPLIEASSAGLQVLASELDYVRDLLDPIESFDPHSPLSIARAVNRFMRHDEKKVFVLNADAFMRKVFDV